LRLKKKGEAARRKEKGTSQAVAAAEKWTNRTKNKETFNIEGGSRRNVPGEKN